MRMKEKIKLLNKKFSLKNKDEEEFSISLENSSFKKKLELIEKCILNGKREMSKNLKNEISKTNEKKVVSITNYDDFEIVIYSYDKPKRTFTSNWDGNQVTTECDWDKKDVCKITGTKGSNATPLEFMSIIYDKKTGTRLVDSDGETTEDILDSFCYRSANLIGELTAMAIDLVDFYKKNKKDNVKFSWFDI